MNSDQLNSLVRTVLKILGGIFLSHGLIDAAGVVNSADFIGATSLIAGLVWSAYVHKSAPAGPSNPTPGEPLLLLAFMLGGALFFSGCSTTSQQTTYRAAGTTIVSVDTAMNLWGAYVAANHPSTNTEAAVKSAYEKYQASMAVVCDAGAAYSATGGTNATATAALQEAVANSNQEIVDLENVISSFGVKLQ